MNETIEVNGEVYKKVNNDTTKLQILVLQRGWVIVGNVTQNGDYLTITDTSVIRVWGTTKGIGEIAISGPTSKTKLDDCPTNTVHILTVVTRIDCDESKW